MAALADAAKPEGKVVVYGPPGKVTPALVDAFQKDYPSVKVEFWSPGQTSDLVTRVTSEAKAGKLAADVVIWGATTQWGSLTPLGIYDSIPEKIVIPDAKNKDVWSRGKIEYADKDNKNLVVLQLDMGNTLVVNPNDPLVKQLKSYQDLLKPEWKGKIAVADPDKVGQALYSMAALYDGYGEEFFKKLGANEPKLAADATQIAEWVARGVYPVGISAGHTLLVPYIKQGLAVEGRSLEFSYVSSGYWTAGLMKQAPHPKAAQLYINWLLGKNAQEAIALAALKAPVRTDAKVPEGVLPLDKAAKLYEPAQESNGPTNDKAIEAFNK